MGVTNLDGTQDDCHVKNAAEFAMALIEVASRILIDEDDPEKGFLRIRVGFHSGSVVSNVIGNVNPRYSLFGDTGKKIAPKRTVPSSCTSLSCRSRLTPIVYFVCLFIFAVHIASKMESKSYSRKIQCSDKSAKLLLTQAPEIRLTKRGKIDFKGKGDITTYWVDNPNITATETGSPGAYKDFSDRCEDPASLGASTTPGNASPALAEVELSA